MKYDAAMRYCENVVDLSSMEMILSSISSHSPLSVSLAWLSGKPRLLQARPRALVLDVLDPGVNGNDFDPWKESSSSHVRYLWISCEENSRRLFLELIPLGYDCYIGVIRPFPSFVDLIGACVVTRPWSPIHYKK